MASPFLQKLIEPEPDILGPNNRLRDTAAIPRAVWAVAGVLVRPLAHSTDCRSHREHSERSGAVRSYCRNCCDRYVNYIVRHRLSDETWLSGSQKNSGVLHNRFSMLPPATEKVLQFLAVSTQPLGIHQLQTGTRIMPGQLLSELNHLSGQGWIRFSGMTLDSEVEISHERFREVVLQSIMEDRLQRRHYRLARMLSSEVPPPWRRIAHHYSEARQYREAAACYMEGARAAARRLSYVEALWMLERAFHPQAQRTEGEVRSAMRLKADCLAGHGNALAAAHAYEQLAQSADSDKTLMHCLAGEQWIRAGRLAAGLESLRTVLRQLDVLSDSSPWLGKRVASLALRERASILPKQVTLKPDCPAFSEIEQCLNRISGPPAVPGWTTGGRLITRMFHLALERVTNFDRLWPSCAGRSCCFAKSRMNRRRAVSWIRLARGLARSSTSQNSRSRVHGVPVPGGTACRPLCDRLASFAAYRALVYRSLCDRYLGNRLRLLDLAGAFLVLR